MFERLSDFLALYIQEHPDLPLRAAQPGLMLDASSEVSLAVRLHELGLFSEEHRAAFVAKINDYTFDGSDFYALENAHIQSVYTPEELSDFRRRLREELVPKLRDIRYEWQTNRDSDQEPDGHMQPLIDGFKSLKKEFAGDPTVLADIDKQITFAEEWISEKQAEDETPKERPLRHAFGDVETQDQPRAQARSIFDDVDE